MSWAGVFFLGFMLGALSVCGLVAWWCIVPEPRDYSADDFELNQQREQEGRDGDDAEVA